MPNLFTIKEIIYLIGEVGELVKEVIVKHDFSVLRSVLAWINRDALQTVGAVYSLIDIRCGSSHKRTVCVKFFGIFGYFHKPFHKEIQLCEGRFFRKLHRQKFGKLFCR